MRVEENFADGLSSSSSSSTPRHLPPAESPAGVDQIARKGPITEVPYDKLVIAVGAYSQTFGIEGVRQHAHFLRDVSDARKIRLRVLSLFEQCTSPAVCKFLIVVPQPSGTRSERNAQ